VRTRLTRGLRHQFPHGLGTVGDEEVRSAGKVLHGDLVYVDAEIVVEGGEDFAEGDRSFGGFAAEAIGGADDLAGFHSAAG